MTLFSGLQPRRRPNFCPLGFEPKPQEILATSGAYTWGVGAGLSSATPTILLLNCSALFFTFYPAHVKNNSFCLSFEYILTLATMHFNSLLTKNNCLYKPALLSLIWNLKNLAQKHKRNNLCIYCKSQICVLFFEAQCDFSKQ